MEDRSEKALELHKKGYNCAQAVFCAYCDEFEMDDKTAFAMAEGFGAGMGDMQGTCGAVSALLLLAGLKNSSGQPVTPATKAGTYKLINEMKEKFAKKNSSLICRELKGLTGGAVLRSCSGCIEDACHIAAECISPEE